MEVQITSRRRIPGLSSRKMRQKAHKVLKDLGLHDVELSLLLTDDDTISELNRRYLRKNGPTNVLAFPMGQESFSEKAAMLGDVVISLDTAMKESNESGESLDRTVSRLLVHGILHLLGHDHEKSRAEARRMKKEEQRLLALISGDNNLGG
jgi:probable rRNA maturation factor